MICDMCKDSGYRAIQDPTCGVTTYVPCYCDRGTQLASAHIFSHRRGITTGVLLGAITTTIIWAFMAWAFTRGLL